MAGSREAADARLDGLDLADRVFFGFIACMLFVLTLLAIYRPETPRVGILRFPTTRGDRFFVTMIGSAFIFIFWMRFGGGDSLVSARRYALLYGIAMFAFA